MSDKKKMVRLNLVGLNGNAFALMGAFKHQAVREGWLDWEIDQVLHECMKGDYDHLLVTLSEHCDASDSDD